jgi:predicted nucleotidyltransferase
VTVTLDTLRQRRSEVLDLAHRRGVRKVWVFGSVARGEANPDSDVDFLVEFEPGRSLFDQVHLINDLGTLLGTRVDVVARGGLLERDQHIVDEAIPL